jgi:hypothetical protein
MRFPRRWTYCLAAALAVAVSLSSAAVAAAPGDWTDNQRQLTISVSNDGKHITGVVWHCTRHRTIRRGFVPGGRGPKIARRPRGRFSFARKARVFRNGERRGRVLLRMVGQFRRYKGKRRALGTIEAGRCGHAYFLAKPPRRR